ncbi:hypothetical protein GCK72_000986 [Caenorhabditis remanei]|uniref:Tyrosine-protein kinase n=1 Tax=Caenorhabditis remanei TaxID=31234 RepID=A0A6A5HTR7_CAERE|nr:hypothetical protein GCK72_000986 [Caenorhabditis remanei]KAF1769172.1 hypothetical protein GCK72_000986 [Caenorhabditis remanei]
MTKAADQNSCQTAEAIGGTRESKTNLLVIDGPNLNSTDATENGGNTTDMEHSGHSDYPDLPKGGGGLTSDEEYIRLNLLPHLWYHGVMFGKTSEKLLGWENSYLIRRAVLKDRKFLCISVCMDKKVLHLPLSCNSEGWACGILFEKFPAMPNKRYTHILDLLNAWSLSTNYIVPIPRDKMILLHSSIQFGSVLGKGAFGEVFKGKYTPIGGSDPVEVAVKRMIGEPKREIIQDFFNEVSIMSRLDHRNVVTSYGPCTLQFPVMLVMELVPGGDLRKYLQKTPNIPHKQIILFALDISKAMCHLATKVVIHRDLAARNCLITKDIRVKLSDFGLSVHDTETVVKNLRKAPIRWLSPETLTKGIFNEKTDVWSYGVLCTELMTRCAADPLAPRDLKEVQKWIKESDHPHRTDGGAPRELIEIVDYCCEKSPSARPDFETVRKKVHRLYQKFADLELAHALSPNPNVTPPPQTPSPNPIEKDRRSNTDRRSTPDRRLPSNANTLTRKKSRDQNARKKEKTVERKAKEKEKQGGAGKKGGPIGLSSRRKDQKAGPVALPAGMSPGNNNK